MKQGRKIYVNFCEYISVDIQVINCDSLPFILIVTHSATFYCARLEFYYSCKFVSINHFFSCLRVELLTNSDDEILD